MAEPPAIDAITRTHISLTSGSYATVLEDIFDVVLNLEDQYYQEGYALGTVDGERAGRIEGRIFGMEKGFEKFLELGMLHGRARVWQTRMDASRDLHSNGTGDATWDDGNGGTNDHMKSAEAAAVPDEELGALYALPKERVQKGLKQILPNPRLAKHIETLLELTNPLTISTQNDEDAIDDFDDRLKRAAAKSKVVESIIGEGKLGAGAVASTGWRQSDAATGKNSVKLMKDERSAERNIEDFPLSPSQR